MLFLTFLLSAMKASGSQNQPTDSLFEPSNGWILVSNGTIQEVELAIRDYDRIRVNRYPGHFRIELHPQRNGKVAVRFPDGFPAYDLPNLTGWLSAPPDQPKVSGAECWITSPGNGEKYYLEPELSNPWGDTLIGASSSGTSVRVSLPETGLSEVSSSYAYKVEPEIEFVEDPVMIRVTLDTNTHFGNPTFVIDSPKDHDWRW